MPELFKICCECKSFSKLLVAKEARLINKVMDRPRNPEGKFVKSSVLGEKTFGVKLYREDEKKLIELAQLRNVSPTELVREIAAEWLNSLEGFHIDRPDSSS